MVQGDLEAAIKAIDLGEWKEARAQLQQIIKADVHNVPAWLWYAKTCPSAAERAQVLQACLRFNPGDPRAEQMLRPTMGQAQRPAQDSLRPTTVPERAAQQSNPGNQAPTRSSMPRQADLGRQPAPGGGSKWFLAISMLLLATVCGAGGWIAYRSMGQNSEGPAINLNPSISPDPADYRHSGPVEYYLYVPRDYAPDRDWPLFVGIHGSGGSGLDCWNWWQSYADREGFILLCPSIADSGGGWYQTDGETRVLSAINEVRAAYRVAPREFMAGFSAGAQFAQGFAFDDPRYVSGVAVLSAGNYYAPSSGAAGIPMLIVIGDRDDPAAIDGSAAFVEMLRQGGFNVEYDILPGVGHTLTDRGRQLTIALFRKASGK